MMAFDMRPFNNSFFDINQGDFIKDLGRQVFNQSPFSASSITTDIKELDNAYVVEAELPGMDKENISLTFDNNILTIEGKQSIENNQEDEEGRVIRKERGYSNVRRQFTFNGVDQTAIKASYDNGMLNVTLPKSEQDNSDSQIQID